MIRTAAFSAARLLRAWLATVRIVARAGDGQIHPPNPIERRFIYAFWHESFLAPAKIRTNVKVLISQSADGELIAQVCRHLGLETIRGSSKRGGAQALLQLLRDGQQAHLAITPDGPRGPRRQVKSGLVMLASLSGLPVVPVGIGFTHAYRFASWDRFALPRPFSTIAGVLGTPLIVPPDLNNTDVEAQRRRVEDALLDATHAAERWAEQLAQGQGRGAEFRRTASSPIRWQTTVSDPHEPLFPSLKMTRS